MKAILNTKLLTIELEADSQLDMFRSVAATQEVFGETRCGLCQSDELRYRVRVVQGNEFPELLCLNPDCGAKLSYGQSKDKKSIFPIRKLTKAGVPHRKTGSYGKHNGWTKYHGEQKEEA